MSSKQNPGNYDCYANADPDEEMFVLLGRDGSASALTHLWALMREKQGDDPNQIADARECASRLAAEAQKRGKPVLILDSLLMMASSFIEDQSANKVDTGSTRPVNAPPEVGDVVVAGRGAPAKLVRIFTKEDDERVRGKANIQYPLRDNVVTVEYMMLRLALPEEVVHYKSSGGV